MAFPRGQSNSVVTLRLASLPNQCCVALCSFSSALTQCVHEIERLCCLTFSHFVCSYLLWFRCGCCFPVSLVRSLARVRVGSCSLPLVFGRVAVAFPESLVSFWCRCVRHVWNLKCRGSSWCVQVWVRVLSREICVRPAHLSRRHWLRRMLYAFLLATRGLRTAAKPRATTQRTVIKASMLELAQDRVLSSRPGVRARRPCCQWLSSCCSLRPYQSLTAWVLYQWPGGTRTDHVPTTVPDTALEYSWTSATGG